MNKLLKAIVTVGTLLAMSVPTLSVAQIWLSNGGAISFDDWGYVGPNGRGAMDFAPMAPTIAGFWSDSASSQIIFLFGDNFIPYKTEVAVGGVVAPVVQVLDKGLLFFLAPSTSTGFVTASTPSGAARSSTQINAPLLAHTITGVWPSAARMGEFVFVFGQGFVGATTDVNGIRAPIAQTMAPTMLFFVVPPGPAPGPGLVNVTVGASTVSFPIVIL